MRRVSAIEELHPVDTAANLTLDRIELRQCSIFIVATLDQQQRTIDARQIGFDVPVAKSRREPDVVPAAKRRIDVEMIASEPSAQVSAFVVMSGLRDAGNR